MTKRLAKQPTLDEIKQAIPFPALRKGDTYSWSLPMGLGIWRARFGNDGRLIWLQSPGMFGDTGYTEDWKKYEFSFGS